MEQLFTFVRETTESYVLPHSTELQTAWIALAIVSFTILISNILVASYGRHYTKHSIIPSVDGKVGWMCMELVSPVTVWIYFQAFQAPGPRFSKGSFLLTLWMIHYSNRAVFSVVFSPSMKSSRLDTVLYSMFFNFINAGWVGYDLASVNLQPVPITLKFTLGFLLFVIGMAINISSDYHLKSLRRKTKGGEYVLPEWGLFKYILSPNYAGETVEWIGYSLMLERESAWTFVLWTVCNLFPRARANLRWYKEKFGDKVGNRKSFIPGVI